MSEKSGVTIKLEALTKALLQELARLDHRTMASWVTVQVEQAAERLKLDGEALMTKAKERRVAQEKENAFFNLPDFVDAEVWSDFLQHREELKKPLKGKGLTYFIHELTTAHKNGWDVNDLLAEAMAKGWQGAVFEKHKMARGDGQEPVKPMTTQEILRAKEEIQQKMLSHVGITGSNRGRFADPVLIEAFIRQLLGEDLSTAYATLDSLITDFYKKGTSIEENNTRIQELLK